MRVCRAWKRENIFQAVYVCIHSSSELTDSKCQAVEQLSVAQLTEKEGGWVNLFCALSLSIVSSISIIDSKKLMLIFLSRQVDRWAGSEKTHIIKQHVLYSCKHSVSAPQMSQAASISTGLWVREYLHPTIYLFLFSACLCESYFAASLRSCSCLMRSFLRSLKVRRTL